MYKTGAARMLNGEPSWYEALSRTDLLYAVLGVAVRREARHDVLAALQLAPMTVYPDCDWCSGHPVKGSGPVQVYRDLRWAFHADCRDQALRDAPSSSSLLPFTRWLTQEEYGLLCSKLLRKMGSVTDLLSGVTPCMANELRQAFEELDTQESGCEAEPYTGMSRQGRRSSIIGGEHERGQCNVGRPPDIQLFSRGRGGHD